MSDAGMHYPSTVGAPGRNQKDPPQYEGAILVVTTEEVSTCFFRHFSLSSLQRIEKEKILVIRLFATPYALCSTTSRHRASIR